MEPIHHAVREGNLPRMEQLLGEDETLLNARGGEAQVLFTRGGRLYDIRNYTPLMVAATSTRTAVLERLLDLGADVRMTDSNGWSAAHWACASRKPATLAALIRAGCPLHDNPTTTL